MRNEPEVIRAYLGDAHATCDGAHARALLEVRTGLHASYGERRVLHGIDFAVEQGGVTALLGANGAGKTTTLRAICGMLRRRAKSASTASASTAPRPRTSRAEASRTCRTDAARSSS